MGPAIGPSTVGRPVAHRHPRAGRSAVRGRAGSVGRAAAYPPTPSPGRVRIPADPIELSVVPGADHQQQHPDRQEGERSDQSRQRGQVEQEQLEDRSGRQPDGQPNRHQGVTLPKPEPQQHHAEGEPGDSDHRVSVWKPPVVTSSRPPIVAPASTTATDPKATAPVQTRYVSQGRVRPSARRARARSSTTSTPRADWTTPLRLALGLAGRTAAGEQRQPQQRAETGQDQGDHQHRTEPGPGRQDQVDRGQREDDGAGLRPVGEAERGEADEQGGERHGR